MRQFQEELKEALLCWGLIREEAQRVHRTEKEARCGEAGEEWLLSWGRAAKQEPAGKGRKITVKRSQHHLLAISNPERWCCESAALNVPANLENAAVPQDWKRSVFIPIPKKGNPKECSNCLTIAVISHASNAQNSPSQASAICEPWTSRCSSWI